LRLLVEAVVCGKSALTTAWFLDTVNHWVDLMSSRHSVITLSKFNYEKYLNAVKFFFNMVNEFDLFRHVTIGTQPSAEWHNFVNDINTAGT